VGVITTQASGDADTTSPACSQVATAFIEVPVSSARARSVRDVQTSACASRSGGSSLNSIGITASSRPARSTIQLFTRRVLMPSVGRLMVTAVRPLAGSKKTHMSCHTSKCQCGAISGSAAGSFRPTCSS
jgi:hypothetical protein